MLGALLTEAARAGEPTLTGGDNIVRVVTAVGMGLRGSMTLAAIIEAPEAGFRVGVSGDTGSAGAGAGTAAAEAGAADPKLS